MKSPTKKPKATSAPQPLTHGERIAQAKVVLKLLRAKIPNPHCELYYETPFQLLVSVALSAHTTDKVVNRCMEPLYKAGLTPQTILDFGEDRLRELIRPIGLCNTKAKNVMRLTAILVSEHGGEVPHSREILESLPGVGRKTANVILGEIFGEPTLAVDTHVFRVTGRLGLHAEKTPEKAEQILLSVVNPKELPVGHHLFILHGRYTCKAQRPLCEGCVLAKICPARQTFNTVPKPAAPKALRAHTARLRQPAAKLLAAAK